MASRRPTVTISDAQIRRVAERANRAAAVRCYKVAEFGAEVMEREVVDIVSREFINDRAPQRRKEGATKLINSFRGVVKGTRGQFPVSATLTIKPGVNAKKVAALDRGYDSYTMSAGPNGFKFPNPRQGGGKWQNRPDGPSPLSGGKLRNAYGKNDFWTGNDIEHPGFDGVNFMGRARDRAVRAMKDYARTLR